MIVPPVAIICGQKQHVPGGVKASNLWYLLDMIKE
jgi:hypothetical protein